MKALQVVVGTGTAFFASAIYAIHRALRGRRRPDQYRVRRGWTPERDERGVGR